MFILDLVNFFKGAQEGNTLFVLFVNTCLFIFSIHSFDTMVERLHLHTNHHQPLFFLFNKRLSFQCELIRIRLCYNAIKKKEIVLERTSLFLTNILHILKFTSQKLKRFDNFHSKSLKNQIMKTLYKQNDYYNFSYLNLSYYSLYQRTLNQYSIFSFPRQ